MSLNQAIESAFLNHLGDYRRPPPSSWKLDFLFGSRRFSRPIADKAEIGRAALPLSVPESSDGGKTRFPHPDAEFEIST